jgi:predicted glycosyltransferase involved in capsule biosynthesis
MHLSIIIPYRDRADHLEVFIRETKGKINADSYDIIVVNQDDNKPFNRAKLLNIGFDYVKDKSDYVCFHDIDMIPVNIDYSYPDKPYHLAINLPQSTSLYYGGVNIFNKTDFLKINGFSNEYWGWGGEDDDLLNRIRSVGFDIYRKDGKFKSLYHEPNGPEHENYSNNLSRCRGIYNYQLEGLNTLKYELNSIEELDENVFKINVCI